MVKRSGQGLANYLKKLVPESTGAHVKVGVLENSKYPDGTPVPLVAFWNEYGTRTAPPRPFFRDTIEQNKKNWSDMTLRGIGRGLPVLTSILFRMLGLTSRRGSLFDPLTELLRAFFQAGSKRRAKFHRPGFGGAEGLPEPSLDAFAQFAQGDKQRRFFGFAVIRHPLPRVLVEKLAGGIP